MDYPPHSFHMGLSHTRGEGGVMTKSFQVRLASQWLQYCLSIGWSKESLGGLLDLFWKHEGWRTFKGYRSMSTVC